MYIQCYSKNLGLCVRLLFEWPGKFPTDCPAPQIEAPFALLKSNSPSILHVPSRIKSLSGNFTFANS